MQKCNGTYKRTKTTAFLIYLNKFGYVFGLPNFWVEDLDFSDMFKKLFDQFSKYGNWSIFALILSEYAAFFTQKNLTERQSSDLILFTVSQTIITAFRVHIAHQEAEIKNVMFELGIGLKEVYNDIQVEDQMIKRSKFFVLALTFNCVMALCMYTFDAVLRVVRDGVTFNTIITAWPDVEDRSVLSDLGRVMFYIFWWIYLTRTLAVYCLVICLNIAVSHQFKNLNSYFHNLHNIFDEDNHLKQREKEEEYERSLKVGIKMHFETLKCTSEIQTICRHVFSGQIIFNLTMLIVLMYQMVNSERNLTIALTLVMTALTILLSTGFFMWNAGDITVEAEALPSAMFSSGWENCRRGSSARVKKLIVIAMMQAQQPVVFTGLGIIALSYQSYVSIVKSSYSVFSVLY